jgi:hypothetical protein
MYIENEITPIYSYFLSYNCNKEKIINKYFKTKRKYFNSLLIVLKKYFI